MLQEIKTFVSKKASQEETIFTVNAPPHAGNYKLQIFGAHVPRTKAKLNLAVVATFVVQVKMNEEEMKVGVS